jgi:hypothetical protein
LAHALASPCLGREPKARVATFRFNYDKSKVKEYQLAVKVSLGNLWVVDSIGHLGANEFANLMQ